jgi:hypothetical protein
VALETRFEIAPARQSATRRPCARAFEELHQLFARLSLARGATSASIAAERVGRATSTRQVARTERERRARSRDA